MKTIGLEERAKLAIAGARLGQEIFDGLQQISVMRTSSHLVNRKAVRNLALQVAHQTHRPFKRVSGAFLNGIEDTVRAMVAARVHRAPGGKTLGLLLVVGCGLLSGCVSGQHIATGPAPASIVATDAVEIVAAAPVGAVELGLVRASADGSNQDALDRAARELRRQAGLLGGNAVVIGGTSTQQTRGAGPVGVYGGGVIFQPPVTTSKTMIEGRAYLIEARAK